MRSLDEKREHEALAEATLTDQHGNPAKLSDEWSDGTVVLAFVRHFG